MLPSCVRWWGFVAARACVIRYMDPVYGNTVIGPPSVIVNATLGPGRNVCVLFS
jgi:hypothetical protein